MSKKLQADTKSKRKHIFPKEQPIAREVDFLAAYLKIIDPNIAPSDRYADILSNHIEEISREIDRLREGGDWKTLLEIRVRLREYFEYSGRYKDGWKFGIAYVEALKALGQLHERLWVQIKDVGYMLILDGQYVRGREQIKSVLDEVPETTSADRMISTATLRFYGYRYLGISYQRAPDPDLYEASTCFHRAGVAIEQLPQGSREYRALWARLQGNFGNIAFDTGDMANSLEFYNKSFAAFQELDDLEHAGIASINIAKTLICQNDTARPDPLPYLLSAQSAFSQIAWLEGQGRVHEQLGIHYLALARRTEDAANSEQHARRALSEAKTAMGIFKRMQSERLGGRIEVLMEGIRHFISCPA